MIQVSTSPIIASTPSQIRQIAKAKFWHDKVTELIKERSEGVDFRGQIGDYKVTSILAVGGMSVVFEVEDVNSGNKYVAKIGIDKIKKDALLYVYQEGRILAHLDDKRIVKLVDVGIHEKYGPFVVMEHVDGKQLSKLINRSGRLAPDLILGLGQQLCNGVKAAHQREVIVRDISPENTMTHQYDIVLIDLGVAKFIDETLNAFPTSDAEAGKNTIIGKPNYLAPELLKYPIPPSNVITDIYSLGATIYFMATGIRPFADRNITKLKELVTLKTTQHPTQPKDLNPDISVKLNEIIMTAVEIDPEKRFADALIMKQALESA